MTINNSDIIFNLQSDNLKKRNEALDFVYKSYYPIIKSMIMDNSGSQVEAEDIFQDSMIVLYSNARKADFKLTCTLKTYLFSIARNLWLNKLKMSNRMVIKPINTEIIELSSEESEIATLNPRQMTIKRQFENLGHQCKEVLYKFYYHRMSMHSIAKDMGLANEQVAKNKKSRCLKKLRISVFKNFANSKTNE